MTTTIKFTAFNVQTNATEQFECHFIQGLHKDAEDAATSKLWYGECWSRDQMAAAAVSVIA